MVGWLPWLVQSYEEKKNTFSKCRDSTLRPVCYKEGGHVPGTPEQLGTSFMTTEMLASCAGLELHTVGLELLLIVTTTKLRWGKDRDKQPHSPPTPSLGSRESAHHLTPPLTPPACYNPWLPPLQIQEVHNSLGNKHCQVPYFKSLNTVGLSNTLSYHIPFSFSFFLLNKAALKLIRALPNI